MGQSQSKRRKRIKQKPINMIGCSKSHKHNKSCSTASCKKCGPNCHCGSNCNCPHKCHGNCYLNRTMKGGGCGSNSCPVGGLTGANLRGGTNLIYTNNTPPGFSYNPGANPSLQATENTGYLMRNTVGGYIYKGKYSKKHSKSVLKGKTKSKFKSHTTKTKTFKNYKYNGGGLIDEIKHNFSVASSAIRGVQPPPDPSPQVQPYLSSIRRPI